MKVQARVKELNSLNLELFLQTIMADAGKKLEPHLQEAAVIACAMRLELCVMSTNELARGMMGSIAMEEA